MTAPLDLTQPEELRDYVWEQPELKDHIDNRIYDAIPGLTEAMMIDALDYATTEGPIDYSRLGFYIETHLPEIPDPI